MKIGILKKGDSVVGVTDEFIAVRRKDGETDIIPIIRDGSGLRVDMQNIVTIGYGDNIVEIDTGENVTITNF